MHASGTVCFRAMRMSNLFSPTLRDDPADAEVVSHKLLLRAGFIRRVTSGVYNFLPLGLRVLRKIEAVVREEMNRAGAQEILMPMVQPAELWKQSGRWDKYGRELLRITDRHDHESCLGPTHEEVVCDLVRRELRSYKQLPMNLYQIQAKFRDEVRPRFGLMRGREFVMKDAYSFHADEDDLAREYQNMFDTYTRIFTRLGLKFRAVQADTGAIGGRRSHEFHVLAESGEDVIAHCSACDYAANVEMATSCRKVPVSEGADLETVKTPGATAVEDVAGLLHVDPALLVKTLVYRVKRADEADEIVAVCVRGDDQVQAVKLARLLGADELVMAADEDITNIGGVAGYVGPQGLNARVLADETLKGAVGLIAGSNEKDAHVTGIDLARDVSDAGYADVRECREGDACPTCGGGIGFSRGIEVGHVFELGRQYAEPMEVVFQNADGKRAVATMGCYGIGVSRLVAAVVEQCYDDAGIIWPMHLAPFHVVFISLGKSEQVINVCKQMYEDTQAAGLEAVWDDRNERPGVKFRDAELMGIPIRVVLGERGLSAGKAEITIRGGEKLEVPLEDVLNFVRAEFDRRAA
ncbi:MAG: proline--tRNA ligase [Mariprofundaceae bacterium]|nr:proline--tRNA ligase [Mariprofundaceae bacterium]